MNTRLEIYEGATIITECRTADCAYAEEITLPETVPHDELVEWVNEELEQKKEWLNGYCPECKDADYYRDHSQELNAKIDREELIS